MKRAIESIDINSAKNDVLKSFTDLMLPRVKACHVIVDNLGEQVEKYENAARLFSECLQNHRFNLLTAGVMADDTRRDKKWTAARYVIAAEMESSDLEHRRTAEVINKIFLSFGKIRQMGFAQQTGAMSSLCDDLLNNHKAELELIGLEGLIKDLQKANEQFQKSYEERTEASSEHKKQETRKAKIALCDAYRALIFLVNALVVKQGSAGMEGFINYANRLIEQYRLIIRQKPSVGSEDVDIDIEVPDGPTPTLPGGGGSEEGTPSEGEQNPNPEPENPGGGNNGENNGGNDNNNTNTPDPDDPWYNPDDEPD